MHCNYIVKPVIELDLSGKHATDRTPPDERVYELARASTRRERIRGWCVYGRTGDRGLERLTEPTTKALADSAMRRMMIADKLDLTKREKNS